MKKIITLITVLAFILAPFLVNFANGVVVWNFVDEDGFETFAAVMDEDSHPWFNPYSDLALAGGAVSQVHGGSYSQFAFMFLTMQYYITVPLSHPVICQEIHGGDTDLLDTFTLWAYSGSSTTNTTVKGFMWFSDGTYGMLEVDLVDNATWQLLDFSTILTNNPGKTVTAIGYSENHPLTSFATVYFDDITLGLDSSAVEPYSGEISWGMTGYLEGVIYGTNFVYDGVGGGFVCLKNQDYFVTVDVANLTGWHVGTFNHSNVADNYNSWSSDWNDTQQFGYYFLNGGSEYEGVWIQRVQLLIPTVNVTTTRYVKWVTSAADVGDISGGSGQGGGGADPTSPSGANWGGDAIDAAVATLVPMIVLLGPAFGLMYLGAGKWGFIGGLTMGACIGYVVMPTFVPLWLVIATVITVTGATIASFRGGF